MATSNATPKQFDILTFAGARERELRGLVELLRSQGAAASPGSEPPTSRHVRRRTASHSSRRHIRRPNTKLEARRKAAQEAGDDGQVRSLMNRAMRRRRGLLLQQASSSCDWRTSDLEGKEDTHHSDDGTVTSSKRKLETHLWHAKRMRMSSSWGWTLPAGAAGEGRGWRVMRRVVESQTSFYGHDRSYWAPLLLSVDGSTSDEGEAKSSLEAIVKRLCSGLISSTTEDAARVHSLLSTGREVTVTLSLPSQVIGPVLLASLPGQKAIICWVHTAAVPASATALRSAGLSTSPLPLRRLELVGTNSTRAALGLLAESSFDWTKLAPSGLVPDGAVAVVRCLDPRLRSESETLLLDSMVSNGNNPTDDDSLVHLLLNAQPAPLSDADVSARRHARRVHEAAVPWEETGASTDSLNAADDDNASLTTSTGAVVSQSCAMALVLHKKMKHTKALAGMSLILPRGWARIVWMELAFQGMRPAGQEEWRELTTRQQKLFFPHDYPQSQAYIQQAREEAELYKQRAERRPSNKPMAVGSCLPSPEDWKHLAESVSREQTSTGEEIAAAEASVSGDLVRVRATLQGKGPALVPGTKILMMAGRQAPSKDKSEPMISIGYVTSAARHARTTAAAFCLASETLVSERKSRFVVRNPGASKAHPVRIERITEGPSLTAE